MKFIPYPTTAFQSADADILEDLTYSGIFVGDKGIESFHLGNDTGGTVHFHVTASGVNPTVIEDVDFSVDRGISWVTTATISGVKPNAITDRILVRFSPDPGDILGVGSFLIRVDEYSV